MALAIAIDVRFPGKFQAWQTVNNPGLPPTAAALALVSTQY